MKEPILTIVVPCYNEEKVLKETIGQLSVSLSHLIREQLIHRSSKLLFVDDGSQDQTWNIIEEIRPYNPFLTGLKLARNVGHQRALLAGLLHAKDICDCVISIDADLQDDVAVIRDFILKYREGYDIVYGVRAKRDTDTFFKRTSAVLFYRFLQKCGVDIVHNHADYRLMSRRALEELSLYEERNVFLRGIVPLIGLSSTSVTYDRKERFAGESKYPLKKMLSFAFDGITSFSVTPIRWITMLGGSVFVSSLFFGMYALWQRFMGVTSPGWTSLVISIWLLGGLQLMSIGLIGAYVGKIYTEVKQRPRFAIDRALDAGSTQIELQEKQTLSTDQEKTS